MHKYKRKESLRYKNIILCHVTCIFSLFCVYLPSFTSNILFKFTYELP